MKIYKFDDYVLLRRKNKVPILEQYEVKFFKTRSDLIETITYVADGCNRHPDVEDQFKVDFPDYTVYRVSLA